jgi:hypothetical protein
MVLGLDMRFLGRKREKKIKAVESHCPCGSGLRQIRFAGKGDARLKRVMEKWLIEKKEYLSG